VFRLVQFLLFSLSLLSLGYVPFPFVFDEDRLIFQQLGRGLKENLNSH
jgi:hypothetical protein